MTFSGKCSLVAPMLGLSFIAICGTRAFGDELADMRAIIAQPVVQQATLDAAKRSAAVINNPCPSAQYTIVDKVAVQKPVTLDVSGVAVSGTWIQAVTQEGCGVSRLLHVAITVSGRGTLNTMPLLPGTTKADPALQRDAAKWAFFGAGIPEKNCDIGYIDNTEFVQYEGDPLEGAKGRPWRETWTVVSCTKKAMVQMRFIPDRTGTSIVSSPNETKTIDLKVEKSVSERTAASSQRVVLQQWQQRRLQFAKTVQGVRSDDPAARKQLDAVLTEARDKALLENTYGKHGDPRCLLYPEGWI